MRRRPRSIFVWTGAVSRHGSTASGFGRGYSSRCFCVAAFRSWRNRASPFAAAEPKPENSCRNAVPLTLGLSGNSLRMFLRRRAISARSRANCASIRSTTRLRSWVFRCRPESNRSRSPRQTRISSRTRVRLLETVSAMILFVFLPRFAPTGS